MKLAAPALDRPGHSEADFQDAVMDLARLHGWLTFHFRPAWVRSGKMITPIQGHAGFPDLVLLRGEKLLFRELKSAKGTVAPAQRIALGALVVAGQDAQVWRPADWPAIQAALR